MEKKLYRSKNNRVFSGVCGGLAEYFNADSIIIRMIAVLLLVFGFFPAVIAYLIMSIIIPDEDSTATIARDGVHENVAEIGNTSGAVGEEILEGKKPQRALSQKQNKSYAGASILGIVIIAIGFFVLLANIFPWFWRIVWPLAIMGIGMFIIMLVIRRK